MKKGMGSSYSGAKNETAEPNTAGHGHAVRGAITEHEQGHVPFPTTSSSTPTNGGAFQATKGEGISKNSKDTGFPNEKMPGGK
jgi:hypothetical protein